MECPEVRSYAVGFEQMLPMYPLDFEEYLWANGVQAETISYLKSCYEQKKPVSEKVHETLCKLFYSYLVVGGMPETVQIYIDTHDIARVIRNQRSILDLYRLDIAKYASDNDKAKIKAIFDSIPAQLNDKNRRFKINSIHPDARLLRYEDSFNWLADAGVALPCYNVTEPQAPLGLNEKRNLFKLYMNDVGLLCAACMENVQFDLLMGNVEIKSGNDFKKHSAMDHALETKQWKFEQTIVFSKSNVEEEEKILYLPWYMIMFFRQEAEQESLIYKIDLIGL